MSHNRGYLRRVKYLKDKRRKEIAKNFKCSRNFWLDEDEDRLRQCDYRLKKRFAKRLASRRARQADNIPLFGNGYRRTFDFAWTMW